MFYTQSHVLAHALVRYIDITICIIFAWHDAVSLKVQLYINHSKGNRQTVLKEKRRIGNITGAPFNISVSYVLMEVRSFFY